MPPCLTPPPHPLPRLPLPTTLPQSHSDIVRRWLNLNVLAEPITNFPRDIVRADGAQLYEAVYNLTRRRMPGRLKRRPRHKVEAAKALVGQYAEAVRFLQSLGAKLNSVAPEHLLPLEEGLRAIGLRAASATSGGNDGAAATATARGGPGGRRGAGRRSGAGAGGGGGGDQPEAVVANALSAVWHPDIVAHEQVWARVFGYMCVWVCIWHLPFNACPPPPPLFPPCVFCRLLCQCADPPGATADLSRSQEVFQQHFGELSHNAWTTVFYQLILATAFARITPAEYVRAYGLVDAGSPQALKALTTRVSKSNVYRFARALFVWCWLLGVGDLKVVALWF